MGVYRLSVLVGAAALGAVGLGVAVAVAGTCFAPFYAQPVGDAGSPAGHISRNNTGGASYARRRIADNFTLAAPGALASIHFWGGDETDLPDAPNENVVAFNFRISDATGPDGGPGATLWEAARTLEFDMTRIPMGFTVGPLNAPEFEYRMQIVPPLQLPAGDYFLSVAAYHFDNNIDVDTETWQWSVAPGEGDGIIAQDRFDFQGMLLRTDIAGTDMAFTLDELTEAAVCAGDVDGDYDVDLQDLQGILLFFGMESIAGDVTGDGFVDLQDLQTVLLFFGQICDPC
jgi:hypothetical protein